MSARIGSFILPMALAVVLLVGSGCSVVQHETATTQSFWQSLTGKGASQNPTNAAAELQIAVMREADGYVGAVAQATDDFRARVPTIEARDMTQQWKLMEATAAYVNATGDNPAVNSVDMVVLASLSRGVVERYWVEKKFGEAARPLLETHRRLETNAWKVADPVLTSGQRE